MSDSHLTTDSTPPHGSSFSSTSEGGWSVTLGCVLAFLTPVLGVLVFLALRAVIGPPNFTTVGYIVLFPIAQVIGATLAFLAGYSSYDLAERRRLGQPTLLQAVFTTLLIALPVYLGVHSLFNPGVVSNAGNAALVAASLAAGVVALLVITQVGKD